MGPILYSSLTALVGFPDRSVGKEPIYNAGDTSSIPGLGRSPGEGKGYPLQYSSLENPMGCIVHGVTKSWGHKDTTEGLSLVPQSIATQALLFFPFARSSFLHSLSFSICL